MNDIRRTILWVIFGFSMVLLWDKWQLHNGNKATFFPTTPAVTAPAAAGAASGATGAASVPSTSAPVAAAATGASAVPGQPAAAAAAPAPRERIEVKTDLYRLVFDSEGGSLTHAELLKHADMADKARNFLLLDESAQRVYVAQTGLIGGTFPTHKTAMTVVPGPRELKDGEDEISVRFESPAQGGVKLVKTWTIKRGAYDIAVKHDIVNTGSAAVSPQLYLQLVRDGNKPPGESSFYSTFTGPAVYTDAKKYQKIEFKDIDNGKIDIPKDSPNGYVAMVQHYFATAWLLADGVQREPFTRKVDTNLYSVGMLTSLGAIEPGATKTIDARLFAGPQVETMMEKLYPGLELVKDYGWLTILSKPLYWLLDQLHKLLNNWGWSIVALVLLLKIAFYWLNAKAYASMAKMKAINPKIMEMRERLKDKPQQMQQEMMRIYREEKVNPLGGCLPIFVQMPFFIALYWVLLSSVEMRGAPWIGWITDLSIKDPYFVLPIIMGITMWVQMKMNPEPTDEIQKTIFAWMPIVFTFIMATFPAGLLIYWAWSNILTILQQYVIMRRFKVDNPIDQLIRRITGKPAELT